MKKVLSTMLALMLCASMLAGCGNDSGSSTSESGDQSSSTASQSSASEESASESQSSSEAEAEGTSASGPITVISREDGSGTRGAFVELLEVTDEDGNDMTTTSAEISNSTEVVIQSVAGNTGAIGYISLGSLDDTVKGVKIDGVEPTAENIENGSYTVSRPFNVATKGELTNEAAQDFMNYIMSTEGQAIVEEEGYIPISDVESFTSTNPSGSVTVSGSSSVSPLMEKLKESYEALNSNVTIELQTSDSTTGMNNTINGMCDIGMASRELKQEELDAGLVNTVIATDGIAIIVNNESPITDLTTEQVRDIYLGNITDWSELG
ncbi:MAG: substrate-binding domain-containing protein [Acutalibacter sp.]|jgi:phosphate transport system substrate-binding protein